MMNKEYYAESDNLIIWRPTGTLNTTKIREFINFLNRISKDKDPHFSRFIDLSHISGISVSYKDLFPIAKQRNAYYNRNVTRPVKMAFLSKNPLTYGMARMYIMLANDPHIEVNIYKTVEEVSEFLGVDISVISPHKTNIQNESQNCWIDTWNNPLFILQKHIITRNSFVNNKNLPILIKLQQITILYVLINNIKTNWTF